MTAAATKRTTTAVARRGSVELRDSKVKPDIDFDAMLAAEGIDLHPELTESDYYIWKGFGKRFRFVRQVNFLNLIMLVPDDDEDEENIDTARYVKNVLGMVHPEDRKDFMAEIARSTLNGEATRILLKSILDGASQPHPTDTQSGSGRTAKRITSKALSAAK